MFLDRMRLNKVRNSFTDELEEFNGVKYKTALKIKNDSYKLEALKSFKDKWSRVEVAKTIQDDNMKIEAIKLFDEDTAKEDIAFTIKDDNIRIKAIPFLKSEESKASILCSIEAFDKIQSKSAIFELYRKTLDKTEGQNVLEKMEEELGKAELVKTIEDDDEKIKYIKSVDSECLKSEVARTIKDDNKKIETISELNNDWSKAIVAKEILDDSKKIEVLSYIRDDRYKTTIIKTINDDNKKMELISLFDDESLIAEIAETIKDDDKKIEIFKLVTGENAKEAIAEAIEDDDKKIEMLESVSDDNKYYVIQSIKDKSKQIDNVIRYCSYNEMKAFHRHYKKDSVEGNEKIKEVAELLKRIEDAKDDNKKLEVIADLNNETLKATLARKIDDDSKKLEAIKLLKSTTYKMEVVDSIREQSKKIECIEELTPEEIKAYRAFCSDFEFIKENIDLFIAKEGFSDQIDREIVDELYEKNNEVFNNIDFRMLKPEYIEMFGKDKINLISCYTNIQEKILDLQPKQLEIFVKCIDDYMGDAQTEEWTTIAKAILDNIGRDEYKALINSIDDLEKVDIDILKGVLQSRNIFGIKSKEEISQYEQIKRAKTDLWIKSNSIEDRRLAVLEQVFGHDIKYAQEILTKYGQDIDSLPDSELKFYVKSIQEIMDCNSSEAFEKMYDECKETTFVDKAFAERGLKTEFGKLYNEGLLKVEDTEELEENMYLAGTDFKMIITSVGAYVKGTDDKNYKEDWNRPALGSQHFCTSYIRNDMIGTAPINDVCYGFTDMAEDSLMLSGAKDLYSSGDEAFVSTAMRDEVYYSPDEQINNTVKHNELDFRRIQNGEKKQPSYIVVFKKNGEISNLENAKRAQKDWGGLPIVVVDVDACLESEKNKVDTMIEEYRETKSPELARQIYYKIRNNRVTEREFCEEIDIEEFNIKLEDSERESKSSDELVRKEKVKDERSFTEDETRKIGLEESRTDQIVTENDLEENYQMVPANERQMKVSTMKRIYRTIRQIKQEDREIG